MKSSSYNSGSQHGEEVLELSRIAESQQSTSTSTSSATADTTGRPPASSSLALAGAGVSLSATLVTPAVVGRGSSTVVAKLTKGPLPSGTRFLGVASASRGRITLLFRSAVLPDGTELDADAEAQSLDGTFGLEAGEDDDHDDRGRGSVAGDVAKETATDLLSSALPDLAGRTLDRYGRAQDRRRRDRDEPNIFLPAGTAFQIFLHKAIRPAR